MTGQWIFRLWNESEIMSIKYRGVSIQYTTRVAYRTLRVSVESLAVRKDMF